MAQNRIVYGARVIEDREILSGDCYIGSSLPGDELAIDTLDFVAQVHDSVGLISSDGYLLVGSDGYVLTVPLMDSAVLLASDGYALVGTGGATLTVPTPAPPPDDMIQYAYGSPVLYYHGDMLVGKFYLSSIVRTGRQQFHISCTSALGLLDSAMHYGGIYNGTKMKTIVADIIGGLAEYTLAPEFENVTVYGWLPIASRRDNLHQLLFAEGAALKKDTAGAIEISFLDSSTPLDIPDDRLFIGGSVDFKAPATKVSVTEHSYSALSTDEVVTLYEGAVIGEAITSPKGVALVGGLITFPEPAHSLSASGAAILESGVNYAVLGTSGKCTLTGKKYTHNTKVITRQPKTRGLIQVADNEVRVENATLVSMANSENIANKVLGYYSVAKNIQTELVVGDERPGDAVTFTDPFGDANSGFVQSLDINISQILRASAVLVAGYVPGGPGNFYNNYAVLSTSGTWTVPQGVEKIRVVLIGGGTGGSSGEDGKPGTAPSRQTLTNTNGKAITYPYGLSGEGGKGGTGGGSGMIYERSMDVKPGVQFAVSIGAGGKGGNNGNLNPGQAGGHTKFGSVSSADGAVYPNGYTNIFTGEIYATPGRSNGIAGGRGKGARTDGGDPVAGETVAGYRPGSDGTDVERWNDPYIAVAYGGLGGGPAYGTNGNSGSTGSASASSMEVRATGGRGGSGATPSIVPATPSAPGSGGDGGHGGGGGGGSGRAMAQYRSTSGSAYLTPVLPAMAYGGSGGKGGDGAPGCVIVYY